MGDDDPPSDADEPPTSVYPAPHPKPAPPAAAHAPTATGEALEATAPLVLTSTTSTPAPACLRAQLEAKAHRLRRPPRRTIPLQQPPVGRLRIIPAGKALIPKPDARPRLSAPQPKNCGRF
eukprot:jgi/Tetstr1/455049/TSEL_041905.t1